MDRFKPMEVEKEDAFVIGIIKSLEKKIWNRIFNTSI